VFYQPKDGHGLPFDPFKAIITPRPIGWISTVDSDGVPNLAPYSFFNALTSSPPMLMFSSETLKHSAGNARDNGEFSFSLATVPLQSQMNASSDALPAGENEYLAAKLEMAPCELITPPRVADSPASMECKTLSCTELKDLNGNSVDTFMVIGQVVAVHINDKYLRNGRFDTAGAQPLARCGYRDYVGVSEVFELMRPTD
jgi:flavin reductase (DIM6/NTAB) family NADH-FMN oxidoreductase RutF